MDEVIQIPLNGLPTAHGSCLFAREAPVQRLVGCRKIGSNTPETVDDVAGALQKTA